MAQLKSTNVYGTLAVTDKISEGGSTLESKYLGIASKASSAASADAASSVPWSGVTNKVDASSSAAGLVNTGAQSFAGKKTFTNDIVVGGANFAYTTSGSDKILTISFS